MPKRLIKAEVDASTISIRSFSACMYDWSMHTLQNHTEKLINLLRRVVTFAVAAQRRVTDGTETCMATVPSST
jgi:hypothetical protein